MSQIETARAELEAATEGRSQIEATYHRALASGQAFDRLLLTEASDRIQAAQARLEQAEADHQAHRQKAISKAASAHVRALNDRITQILDRYPEAA